LRGVRLFLIPLLTLVAAYFVLKDFTAVGTVVLGGCDTGPLPALPMRSATNPFQNEIFGTDGGMTNSAFFCDKFPSGR